MKSLLNRLMRLAAGQPASDRDNARWLGRLIDTFKATDTLVGDRREAYHERVKTVLRGMERWRVDVNAPHPRLEGDTLLVLSARAGHGFLLGVPELLIEAGLDVDALDSRGRTALHYCASLGHEKFLDLLISAGADPNLGTPVFLACERKHWGVLEALVKAGANVDVLDDAGRTLLACAESTYDMQHKARSRALQAIQRASYLRRGSLEVEKERARRGAAQWWEASGLPDAVCDSCSDVVAPSSGYRRLDSDALPGGYVCGAPPFGQGELLCEACFDRSHPQRHARASHPWVNSPREEACPECGLQRDEAWSNLAYCTGARG